MRGFLLEVATKKQNLYEMDADTFAGTRDGASFAEWYADMKEPLSREHIQKALEMNGCICRTQKDGTIQFSISEDAKERYFNERYQKFLEAAKKMSLKDFASGKLDQIRDIMEDSYSNAVYLAEEQYAITFDQFFRMAQEDTNYFIGNLIAMH